MYMSRISNTSAYQANALPLSRRVMYPSFGPHTLLLLLTSSAVRHLYFHPIPSCRLRMFLMFLPCLPCSCWFSFPAVCLYQTCRCCPWRAQVGICLLLVVICT
ncbi:hypothetical protein F4778DRAFT_713840 [Xylariomycetidae sp. FL2044]|nr:hypothetical protein F4778DRAFT_713840 [Xylariomycetidae sp. FL2044]